MITWQEWGYIIGGYLSGSVLYSYLPSDERGFHDIKKARK